MEGIRMTDIKTEEFFLGSIFQNFKNLIAKWEGDVSDHPEDPGGFTRRGVSLRYNPEYTKEDLMNFSNDEIDLILYNKYGKPFRIWNWSPGLALAFYDCSINQGPGAAVSVLQRTINTVAGEKLQVDGIFGSKTEGALLKYTNNNIHTYQFRNLLTQYLANRMTRYCFGSDTFAQGWSNRLMDIAFFAYQIELEWMALHREEIAKRHEQMEEEEPTTH